MAVPLPELGSVAQASGDHPRAELHDGTVLLHLGSGEYFRSSAAGHVRQVLQESISVAAPIEQQLLQYAVGETRCRTETMSMRERLQAEGFPSIRSA